MILITLGIIVEFNVLFSDYKKAERMVHEAKQGMSDDFKRTAYYFARVKRIAEGIFIYSIIMVMCMVQINLETNILNWLFFIVNIMNLVILISGASTQASLKRQERIATFIKLFAIIIIVIDILFIFLIGEFEKKNKPDSLDQKFKKALPLFYNHLDIIGFRSNNAVDEHDFTRKFVTYVSYFLLSLYLENHFIQQQRISEGEEKFSNEEYKKLFEWKDETEAKSLMDKFIQGGKIALKGLATVDAGILENAYDEVE
jgi:hypothetical protein